MKLAIGTANFGEKYGLTHKKNNLKDIKKVFKFAKLKRINLIDTSINYRFSHINIGKFNNHNARIVTKIKFDKKDISYDSFRRIFLGTLNDLKIKKIHGILFHDPKILKKKEGKKFLNFLKRLKKEGLVKKIGISIYSANDINFDKTNWKPDIIQFPLNIFDTRVVESNLFKKIKNCELHARSCFLQGSLINNKFRLNKKLIKFKRDFINFDKWTKKAKINKIDACIHFIKKFKKIDYLIVGFDNYDQFIKIYDSFSKKTINITKSFDKKNLKLLDPRLWN
jgi:aryl-alcohol dehydrogenase-like predicted oxidoreductase